MNRWILFGVAASVSGMCLAQETATVLSSTPVVQQVAVPHQACYMEQVGVSQPKSGAGAAVGAIAGGAMGNAIGNGSGRAAATVLGLIGGAIVGDRIEGSGPPQLQTVQRCSTQNIFENRTIGYNVVYEYAGKQYSVQLPQDPGPTLQVQVTPIGANAPAPGFGVGTYATPPAMVQQQSPAVVVQQPVYPAYYTRPYYPPITLELGYGYWGGGRRGYDHRR